MRRFKDWGMQSFALSSLLAFLILYLANELVAFG